MATACRTRKGPVRAGARGSRSGNRVSGSAHLSLFSGWTIFRFGGGARRRGRSSGGGMVRSVFAGLGKALFGQGTGGGGGGSSAGRAGTGSRSGGRATGAGRSGASSFARFQSERPELFEVEEDQDVDEAGDTGADAGAGGED